jgi:hypothetical protein
VYAYGDSLLNTYRLEEKAHLNLTDNYLFRIFILTPFFLCFIHCVPSSPLDIHLKAAQWHQHLVSHA